MSQIPYADSYGRLSVEVHLKKAADVFLVDSVNYKKFQKDEDFKYFDGHYAQTPVIINVSGSGRWYLIVYGSDYQYRFY